MVERKQAHFFIFSVSGVQSEYYKVIFLITFCIYVHTNIMMQYSFPLDLPADLFYFLEVSENVSRKSQDFTKDIVLLDML